MKYLLCLLFTIIGFTAQANECVAVVDAPEVKIYRDSYSYKPILKIPGKSMQDRPWLIISSSNDLVQIEQVGTIKKIWVDKNYLKTIDPDECEFGD